MHCPKCHATDTKVIDSRLSPEGDSVRRRRKCELCETRFTTYEKTIRLMPVVVKEDGRREDFSREKILGGLVKATGKRPISAMQLDEMLDDIEKTITDSYGGEVPSYSVGEIVMDRLMKLDPVAYVRYASFYWDFKDIESFVSILSKQTGIKRITRRKSSGQENAQLSQ